MPARKGPFPHAASVRDHRVAKGARQAAVAASNAPAHPVVKKQDRMGRGMSEEAPESGGGRPPTDPQMTVQVPKASGRVFVSYASQDAAVAQRVCAALEAAGLPCWIAPRDVRAGESYAAAIVQAINSCWMLILVLSKGAIESSHVLREVERASSKKRPSCRSAWTPPRCRLTWNTS